MPYLEGCQGRIFRDSWLPDRDARSLVVLLQDQKVTSGSPTKSATKLTKKNPKNKTLRTRIT